VITILLVSNIAILIGI